MKKIVSAVLVFVMMLSLAGCGISYDDIKGDWTAKTINGMTIDEYAASLGVDPSQATVNVNITENLIMRDVLTELKLKWKVKMKFTCPWHMTKTRRRSHTN